MSFLDIPPEILSRPDPPIPLEPWREFEPNSIAQGLAMNSWAPAVGYSGRLGSAKTRTCCEGALFDAVFWAGNRVLLTRKRATDLFATTMTRFTEEVLPPKWAKRWRPGALGGPTLYLPNGSVIIFIGLDEPSKIKSAQFGSIYVDQAEDLDEEEKTTAEFRLRHRVRPTIVSDDDLAHLLPSGSPTYLRRELRGKGIPLRRRIVYAFNPDGDNHWGNIDFKFREMQELPDDHPERWRRVYRTTQRTRLLSGVDVPAGQILREAIISRPADNVENLGTGYLIEMGQQYIGPWGRRMVLGFWGTFEGQVLPNFSREVHVIDKPEEWDAWGGYPPPNWKRFRSADFGYGPGHPLAMGWFARRPGIRKVRPPKDFLYQEIYWEARTVPEHAKTVLRWDAEEVAALNRGIERWNEQNPEKLMRPRRELEFAGQWFDPARPGDIATLANLGIVGDPAINDRSPGAQLVAERLEPQRIAEDQPLEPRLVIVRTARRDADPGLVATKGRRPTQTFEELAGLRWLKSTNSDQRGQKEDWVKDKDDGFDMLRYFLLSERERGSMEVITG